MPSNANQAKCQAVPLRKRSINEGRAGFSLSNQPATGVVRFNVNGLRGGSSAGREVEKPMCRRPPQAPSFFACTTS
eukprot:1900537-Pyramimonas_sp.AAC.1